MTIISDGTPRHTKFYDNDGKEIIDKITQVKIDMSPNGIVANITYLHPKLELNKIKVKK